MTYGTTVVLPQPFDEAVAAVRVALADQGFGVLTEIDMQATMRAKLDKDLPPYVISGPATRLSPTGPCWPSPPSACSCPAMSLSVRLTTAPSWKPSTR